MIKGLFKGIYYALLGPLYRRVKAEMADEYRAALKKQEAKFTSELNKLNKELERVKSVNVNQQNRVTSQVSEEFLKMYKLIDDIKSDRADVKLNVALVNELVKIHQSLEALKYERNGHQ